MTEPPICPCEGFSHPQVIFNPPGRSPVFYRIGDYSSFRRALLLPLKDTDGNSLESELINWHSGAEGDLAVQMVEWWAYLADILTFYSDRIANESYLQTASFTESVQRLVRILGYRPRPGIGASGTVAALLANSKPSITLPQGFQIQSKPGPGKQPQIFELDVDSAVQFPDVLVAAPLPSSLLSSDNRSILLKGSVSGIQLRELLLLLPQSWSGSQGHQLVTVQDVVSEKDLEGKINTRITFTSNLNLDASEYRLLRSSQSAQLWTYSANSVISNTSAHLNTIARSIKANDPVLFQSSNLSPLLVKIDSIKEVIWYANSPDLNNPGASPASGAIPIPIAHSEISFTSTQADQLNLDLIRSQVTVHYLWQDVGQIIRPPQLTVCGSSADLYGLSPRQLPQVKNLPILIEDTTGQGVKGKATTINTSDKLKISDSSNPSVTLAAPFQVLLNSISVSRGQTVFEEILGSGNASIAAQEFSLKKSPLTYLLSSDSSSGGNYKSTLRIWVDGIEWKEVPSFYGQPPHARIFVTREDEQQHTTVQFGDGINGARLPSGVDNVIARYRYGSGREAPDAGSLNVIVKPYPNLKAIRNPVPVGGGADPEPPDQIRRYAPRSVLTFGRAVSGDDYETIAAQTPGVSRAKIYWTWDAAQQRSLVKLYVGDDHSAVNAAKIALAGTADPNRPALVQLAQPLPVKIALTLQIEASQIPEIVEAAVKNLLLHSDTGLFGINAIQIGQAIYQSQIYSTCLQVPGVLAVRSLKFHIERDSNFILDHDYRHDPGEGKFYQLLETYLQLNWEVKEP
jgi:hypothetical protein